MAASLGAHATPKVALSTKMVAFSAPTGSVASAQAPALPTFTSAPGAAARLTELKGALERRRHEPVSPLRPDAWARALADAGLVHKYPTVTNGIRYGFHVGIPAIHATRTPPNNDTISVHHDHFMSIVSNEFRCNRYIGPFTRDELEQCIGPFQTSPLSLVPKPHKPDKLRLTQNFSYPHIPRHNYLSINYFIDSSDFPCTWGTFAAISFLCAHLPAGSQGAIRDVREAYRSIPLAPSQWPGTVVQISAGVFALDPTLAFGITSGGGVYGLVADAGLDILRARGMGPMARWVDDHLFIRILRHYIDEYNSSREAWKHEIIRAGGRHQRSARIWYSGDVAEGGCIREFVEDMAFPIRDLSNASERSPDDSNFTYCLRDVDFISNQLGVDWEHSKDQDFSSTFVFTGLSWDLDRQCVGLPDLKRAKYLESLHDWQRSRVHILEEVQKLYG